MGWTEGLFQKAENLLIRMDHQRKGFVPSDQAIRFEEMKSVLNCWVALISGRSWTLQESEGWPASDSERLFFPAVLDIFNDHQLNRRAYFFIACYLLGHDENQFSDLRKWRQQFQAGKCWLGENESPKVLKTLHQIENVAAVSEALPWTRQSYRSLQNLWSYRNLSVVQFRRNQEAEAEKRSSSPQSVQKKKAKERIEVIDSLNDPENDNPMVHSFEKLHTTDDYNGGQKNKDGEDELAEHQDSLEDLDLKQVLRTTQETRATLKGDFVMDLEVAESLSPSEETASRIFHYDEWDEAKAIYHPNWCRLQVRTPEVSVLEETGFDLAEVRKSKKSQIENLSRCFFTLFQSPKWKTRQLDGAELDLDALVNFMATPPERRSEKMNVYMNRRKDLNELSVVLLFDRSLSSDSWVQNSRVLDITRESLVVIGEALKKFPLSVQLAAFSSHTRNKIYYDVLKDFNENWNSGLQRLGSMDPSGYTRIGPALRHAISRQGLQKAKHKWIILLSDAKPTDYDKYEGRYGVRDVRKAIQEARAQDIGVRCLSIEKENRFELAEMFGPRGYELLERVDDLPIRLGLLLKNLVLIAR